MFSRNVKTFLLALLCTYTLVNAFTVSDNSLNGSQENEQKSVENQTEEHVFSEKPPYGKKLGEVSDMGNGLKYYCKDGGSVEEIHLVLEPPKHNRRSRKVLPRNGSVYRTLDQIENVIRYGDRKAQSQPDREKSIVEVKQ